MKSTGIVRRIDELGRVVIPKELRRTMRIREGEEMEVYVAPDDTLVLKKYSVLKDYAEVAQDYVDVLSNHTSAACLVCDTDGVVASSDKRLTNDPISVALEQVLRRRKPVRLVSGETISPTAGGEKPKEIAVTPVLAHGDVLGGVVLYGSGIGEAGRTLCEVAANLLAKQFE